MYTGRMQTKSETEAIDIQATKANKTDKANKVVSPVKYTRHSHFLPFAFLLAMASAIFLLDAVLLLQGLWFHNVLLTQIGPWFQWPTTLLFPGQATTAPLPYANPNYTPPIASGWLEVPFLLAAM